MINLQAVATLTKKQMSRKEFILYVGAVIIALLGVNSLIATLINPKKTNSKGFGAGPYGK